MTAKKQLGIFFGSNSLSIAETDRRRITSFFDAPHSLFDNKGTTASMIPDDIRLTAILQKSLRDKKIETTDISLCLPTKDIILRSFFIPWMTASEVKGVVDFEARRYIPFRLEEIIYGYHTVTVIEKKIKRIRVVFVGIRKDTLEKYCSILEQAGLKIVAIEPSPFSLLRVLLTKRQIQNHQTTAIIYTNKNDGTIFIAEGSIPQFVRDFQLTIPESLETTTAINTFAAADTASLKSRFLDEVRISLDYYQRQHPASVISKILFISPSDVKELSDTLSKDLGIAATSLRTNALLNLPEEVDIGVLNAFGVGLKHSVALPVSIDLITMRTRAGEPEKTTAELSVNYRTPAVCTAGCVFAILAAFLLTRHWVSGYEKKISDMAKNELEFVSLTVDDLKKNREETFEKIEKYKKVPLKSNIAFFLNRLPELLPSGTWLRRLAMNYSSSYQTPGSSAKGLILDIDGYTYAAEMRQQIELINRLILNLKQDFNKTFTDITLVNANREQQDGYTVTHFQIRCQ